MRNKRLHQIEDIGFFIAMSIGSIVIGLTILEGIVKLVYLINK